MQDRIAYQGITFDDVLLEPASSDGSYPEAAKAWSRSGLKGERLM